MFMPVLLLVVVVAASANAVIHKSVTENETEIITGEPVDLAIFIPSMCTAEDAALRDAHRASYWRYLAPARDEDGRRWHADLARHCRSVTIEYFVTASAGDRCDRSLDTHDSVTYYDDRVPAGFVESYRSLSQKSQMLLQYYAETHAPSQSRSPQYVMKLDMDAYPSIPTICQRLHHDHYSQASDYAYMGVQIMRKRIELHAKHKWNDIAWSRDNRHRYRPYMQGAGYLLSAPLARRVASLYAEQLRSPAGFVCSAMEDACVGFFVYNAQQRWPAMRVAWSNWRERATVGKRSTSCSSGRRRRERRGEQLLLHKIARARDFGAIYQCHYNTATTCLGTCNERLVDF